MEEKEKDSISGNGKKESLDDSTMTVMLPGLLSFLLFKYLIKLG